MTVLWWLMAGAMQLGSVSPDRRPAAASPAAPAVASLHGRVVDQQGVGVPRAQVRLIPLDGDASDARAGLSDSSGAFAWFGLSPGNYQLSARRFGYSPVAAVIAVADDADRTITVHLTRVQQLDTIAVRANSVTPSKYGTSSRMDEFYRRMSRGNGRFITRGQIDSMNAISSIDLFRAIPGMSVQTVTLGNGSPGVEVHTVGCSGSAVGKTGEDPDGWRGVALYVDGVMIHGNRAETLASISPADIEGVEIYRSPTELPAEAVGNACAAVYVWTRFGTDSGGP